MSNELNQRITTFLESLARSCKGCRWKGASCSSCAIYGVEGILSEIDLNASQMSFGKSDVRSRKDLILSMLSNGPLTAKEINVECTSTLKYSTLRIMSNDSEIEIVRRPKKQNLYTLPKSNSTKKQEQK